MDFETIEWSAHLKSQCGGFQFTLLLNAVLAIFFDDATYFYCTITQRSDLKLLELMIG